MTDTWTEAIEDASMPPRILASFQSRAIGLNDSNCCKNSDR